ncbi:MAG: type III-B CRISPR module-associated protein Cmr5 [Canidatus Methanoxibalbensis ujae]|nr:type III-B CRISPR module-associated protein Cmr5 [Candidatus Methanoxibalbensis ujae]RLG36136.1 MAG: type III-B CRISPR module-associated protein Cmr5 [Methanosarcinales archaeon]
MLRSLEQERAKYAWECIQEVKEEGEELQKNYNSYVKKAPTLIQTNGLPNALAFYYNRRKREKAYELLYKHIADWNQVKRIRGDKEFLLWIVEDASSMDVFQVTGEVIALLNWMKRFAEAELKGEET